MQLKKASRKTTKAVEKTGVAAEGETAVSEKVAKPRAPRSSKAKKSEGTEMTSGKHLHKLASPATGESAPANTGKTASTLHVEAKAAQGAPAVAIGHEQIAELAYSYWVERGYTGGSADEDWIRAERTLLMR